VGHPVRSQKHVRNTTSEEPRITSMFTCSVRYVGSHSCYSSFSFQMPTWHSMRAYANVGVRAGILTASRRRRRTKTRRRMGTGRTWRANDFGFPASRTIAGRPSSRDGRYLGVVRAGGRRIARRCGMQTPRRRCDAPPTRSTCSAGVDDGHPARAHFDGPERCVVVMLVATFVSFAGGKLGLASGEPGSCVGFGA